MRPAHSLLDVLYLTYWTTNNLIIFSLTFILYAIVGHEPIFFLEEFLLSFINLEKNPENQKKKCDDTNYVFMFIFVYFDPSTNSQSFIYVCSLSFVIHLFI